jgi:hypothetical protein
MSAFYEVWDFETNNIINTVDTEAAAIRFLRGLFDLNGPDGVRDMGIVRQAPDNSGEYEPELVLEGGALLARLGVSSEVTGISQRRSTG